MSFATVFIALYVGHHIGDYWIQTDWQARNKGAAGRLGRLACFAHVTWYVWTQYFALILTMYVTESPPKRDAAGRAWIAIVAALLFSGVTHYLADRREHGLMMWIARRLPSLKGFLTFGVPREGVQIEAWGECISCNGSGYSGDEAVPGGKCWDCRGGGVTPGGKVGDNPSLGSGPWALDQAWHIALGCFVPALIIAALS